MTIKGANYANVSAYDSTLEGKVHHILLDNLTIDGAGGDQTPEGVDQYSFIGISFTGVMDSEIQNSIIRNTQFNIDLNEFNKRITIYNNNIGPSLIANRDYDAGSHEEGRRWSHNINLYSEGRLSKQNTYIYIIGNIIHSSHMQGVLVWRANHVLVRGNHTFNNGSSGIQIESDHSTQVGMTTKHIVVEDNNSAWNSQKFESEAGIWVDDSSHVLVRNNISHSNEVGIYLSGSKQVIARHNIVYNNAPPELIADFPSYISSGGLRVVASPDGRKSINNIIIHNTFYKNGLASQRGHIHLGQWDSWPEGISDHRYNRHLSTILQNAHI